MSLDAICQRCGGAVSRWTMRPADICIGRIDHWKVLLCATCTDEMETAVLVALKRQAR